VVLWNPGDLEADFVFFMPIVGGNLLADTLKLYKGDGYSGDYLAWRDMPR
jgi:hypothetical protein